MPVTTRNLPRVDYTGMDTIEPKSEYDITDIWYDLSIFEDPDYVPDEDCDDECDDQCDDERNKDFDKNTTSVARTRRNIPRINYSGMDMNDEDQGTIYICKTKWNNKVPTYRWVKYPLSQANELNDEEWIEEF
jgi:hypothetical protein